ncbi:MAG: sigma-54-dependent Fis family transcriptional regulator [Desulfuromonadaceae bacterium]|nr:sigma-54-dependent Fis family transcriptional regulator [Desulfuromonadaceae bacterium]
MTVLIVDDEPVQREMLAGFLRHRGYQVLIAADGDEALSLYRRQPVDVVLLDQCMPGLPGDEVLVRLKAINPRPRIIMITAFADVDTAVRVMKAGAHDFVEKPVDLQQLAEKIDQHEEQLLEQDDLDCLREELSLPELPFTFIAESPAMRELLSTLQRVAQSPWAVLIHGETGTGKELVARLIHQLSPRRQQPFVEVNCAAIPDTLFESELFGHEKGSFTGAVSRRDGHFVAANRGSLFLDEIGELPLALQSKLLRALQEKRICPVGASCEREVDVRVVAASNCHLPEMVGQGTFREDLYYRLNVFELTVPPLRQRREDIEPLIHSFLSGAGGASIAIEPAALDALIKYDYPGNVRELRNLMQRLVTLMRGSRIRLRDLPEELRSSPRLNTPETENLTQRLEAVEQELMLTTLQRCDWVQTRAAEALGISERVLRYKMNKYGIRRPDA